MRPGCFSSCCVWQIWQDNMLGYVGKLGNKKCECSSDLTFLILSPCIVGNEGTEEHTRLCEFKKNTHTQRRSCADVRVLYAMRMRHAIERLCLCGTRFTTRWPRATQFTTKPAQNRAYMNDSIDRALNTNWTLPGGLLKYVRCKRHTYDISHSLTDTLSTCTSIFIYRMFQYRYCLMCTPEKSGRRARMNEPHTGMFEL